jgi:anti-sigma B factor antagonist
MTKPNVTLGVRQVKPQVFALDIQGEINAFAETPLMEAYQQAVEQGARQVLLNFAGLTFMNSSGIGLLVTLLIRAQRQKVSLSACGLSDHYRRIFELTRLNEAIACYENEAALL